MSALVVTGVFLPQEMHVCKAKVLHLLSVLIKTLVWGVNVEGVEVLVFYPAR